MITIFGRRSGEGDDGEIESKDGLCKHHGARGRLDGSRCIEESGKTTLVKEGRKESTLYTPAASGP